MIKKLGAIVALGGFVSLVISINQILHKGMATLEETNKTLAEVRNSVRGLTQESKARLLINQIMGFGDRINKRTFRVS